MEHHRQSLSYWFITEYQSKIRYIETNLGLFVYFLV